MRDLLRDVQRSAREQAPIPPEIATLPTIGPGIDLEAACATVRARWFADLPPIRIGWARDAHRRINAIRFGCYRRSPGTARGTFAALWSRAIGNAPVARISIHPRLARPWIARVFLDHVLFHELCHHRQACQPQFRRERAHSPRFRAWEREFPGHADAQAWERAALPWLLDGTTPPWYPQA